MPFPEMERLMAVVLGFVSLALLVFNGGPLSERPVAAPRLAILLVLFSVLVVVSAAWSVAPSLSILFSGTIILCPTTALALMFSQKDPRDALLRFTTWGLGVIVAGLSVWVLLQAFIFQDFLVNGQVRHPFQNPNAFAALLSISIFVAIGLVNSTNKKITLSFIFLALSAFFVIGSKMALIAMILGATIYIGIAFKKFPEISRKALPLSIGVAAFAFGVSLVTGGVGIVSQIIRVFAQHGASLTARLDIWSSALDLIAQNPILGTGYRSFVMLYPSVRHESEIHSGGFVVHSDPLQFWVELGILGPVLFYAMGVSVLILVLRHFRAAGSGGENRLTLALFAGCVTFIAHAHVDFLLYTMTTAMVFGLALGIMVIRTADDLKTAMPFSFIKGKSENAVRFMVSLPVLLFLMLHVPVMMAEYYTNQAQMRARSGDLSGFGALINTADTMGMGLLPRPYLLAASVPLSILKARYPEVPIEEQKLLFAQTDGLLLSALSRNTYLASAVYQRAELDRYVDPSVLPAERPSRELFYRDSLKMDPLYLPARMGLAQFLMDAQRDEEALDVLMGGIMWPYPKFDAEGFYKMSAVLAARLGEKGKIDIVRQHADQHRRKVANANRRQDRIDGLIDGFMSVP